MENENKRRKLIIDRTLWLRGTGSGLLLFPKTIRPIRCIDETGPLRPEIPHPDGGKMCCLGFECLAIGLSPQAIVDRLMPHNVVDSMILKLPENRWLRETDAYSVSDVTIISGLNDFIIGLGSDNRQSIYLTENGIQPPTSEAERESLIAKYFAKHNIDVEFIN